jgi:hypothetical protein
MDDIATEDARYSIALRVNDHVALCVPWRRMDDSTVIDLEPIVHIFH